MVCTHEFRVDVRDKKDAYGFYVVYPTLKEAMRMYNYQNLLREENEQVFLTDNETGEILALDED